MTQKIREVGLGLLGLAFYIVGGGLLMLLLVIVLAALGHSSTGSYGN
jgi:hypothetical protein